MVTAGAGHTVLMITALAFTLFFTFPILLQPALAQSTLQIVKNADPDRGISPVDVTYTFSVFFIDDDDPNLEEVTVTDSNPDCNNTMTGPTGDNGDSVLDFGETWIFTCTVTLNDSATNTVTVDALEVGCEVGCEVSATDSEHVDVFHESSGSSGGCREVFVTNNEAQKGPCVVVDTEPPRIWEAFANLDELCFRITDNVGVAKAGYSQQVTGFVEIPHKQGSYDSYCTNEELPQVVKVVAEDLTGNTSEMIAINPQFLVTTQSSQVFNAVVAPDLNPHHGIEGIILETDTPVKQIRISKSPEFTDKELYTSEIAMKELSGKKLIEVVYKGQYSNTPYGKERHGYIYVFAANKGLLATFDVVVNDDMRIYPHKGEHKYSFGNWDMKSKAEIDKMNLNAWQRAELERVLSGAESTLIGNNIISLLLRSAYIS